MPLCCVIMLCHYAVSLCCVIMLCHYAVSLCCIIMLCHYAMALCCHYAVIMLSIIMLNAVKLIVMAPFLA
jgi:hypothetical protein